MWFRIENALSDRMIESVLSKSGAIARMQEDRHFVKAGKTFFNDNPRLLLSIHEEVSKALGLADHAPALAINHGFLLYKSGPGPATRCHQDRPYWLDIEPSCTMFTVWLALGDVSETMGSLTLNPDTEVHPTTFFAGYRRGELLEHVDDQYGGGGFTITLPEDVARTLEKGLRPQPMKRGDLVVFDAFEPHASTANDEATTRLAMKIVYGDPKSMSEFQIDPNQSKAGRLLNRIARRIGF